MLVFCSIAQIGSDLRPGEQSESYYIKLVTYGSGLGSVRKDN